MSKGEYFIIATGVGAIIVAILPIPKEIAYPIAGILGVFFIALIVKGIRLKPTKQAETSKGLFVIDNEDYDFTSANRILSVNTTLYAMPSRNLESVKLKITGELIDSDWQPNSISNHIINSSHSFHFNILNSIKSGKYNVHLVAYSNGEKYEFQPFEIEIPK
jgi:hypothetical protein